MFCSLDPSLWANIWSDLSAQRDTAVEPEGSSVSLRSFSINADKQFNGLVKILMSKWRRQGHSCRCAALERITLCVPSVAHCSGASSLLRLDSHDIIRPRDTFWLADRDVMLQGADKWGMRPAFSSLRPTQYGALTSSLIKTGVLLLYSLNVTLTTFLQNYHYLTNVI